MGGQSKTTSRISHELTGWEMFFCNVCLIGTPVGLSARDDAWDVEDMEWHVISNSHGCLWSYNSYLVPGHSYKHII